MYILILARRQTLKSPRASRALHYVCVVGVKRFLTFLSRLLCDEIQVEVD